MQCEPARHFSVRIARTCTLVASTRCRRSACAGQLKVRHGLCSRGRARHKRRMRARAPGLRARARAPLPRASRMPCRDCCARPMCRTGARRLRAPPRGAERPRATCECHAAHACALCARAAGAARMCAPLARHTRVPHPHTPPSPSCAPHPCVLRAAPVRTCALRTRARAYARRDRHAHLRRSSSRASCPRVALAPFPSGQGPTAHTDPHHGASGDHATLLQVSGSYAQHIRSGDTILCPIYLHFRDKGTGRFFFAMRNAIGSGPFRALYDLKAGGVSGGVCAGALFSGRLLSRGASKGSAVEPPRPAGIPSDLGGARLAAPVRAAV